MPKRPPKSWWNSCVRGVRKGKSSYNPEAVCGDLWYHKKSQKERIKITRKAESSKRK